MLADRQTDRQTDTVITILRLPYRGRNNNAFIDVHRHSGCVPFQRPSVQATRSGPCSVYPRRQKTRASAPPWRTYVVPCFTGLTLQSRPHTNKHIAIYPMSARCNYTALYIYDTGCVSLWMIPLIAVVSRYTVGGATSRDGGGVCATSTHYLIS